MPKFLDTPTWINKSGQTVEALGLRPGQQTGGKGAGVPYVVDGPSPDTWYIGRANGYGSIPYCNGNGISFGYISFNGGMNQLYPDSSGFYAPIESGMTGQILKSNGASGGAPSWASSKYYHRVSLAYRDGAKSGTVYLSYVDEYGSATGNLSTTDSIYISALCNNIHKSALDMPIPTASFLTEQSGSLAYYYLIIFVDSTNLKALKFTSSGGSVSWTNLPNFDTSTVSVAQDYAIKVVE